MLNIYVTNLANYNGGWIECEAKTSDEIWEEVNEIAKGNDFEVHDYECEFTRITSVHEAIEIAEALEEIDRADDLLNIMKAGYSFEDGIELMENERYYIIDVQCRIFSDKKDAMEEYLYDTGFMEEIPEHFKNYFDFEKYMNDFECEGNRIYHIEGNRWLITLI